MAVTSETDFVIGGQVAASFGAAIGRVQSQFAELANHAQKASHSISSAVEKGFHWAFQPIHLIEASVAGLGLGELVKQSVDLASQMQRTQMTMEVFLRDSSKAAELIKDAQDFANHSPFQFQDIATAAERLTPFTNGIQDTMKLIKELGNVAAGTNQPITEWVNVFERALAMGNLDMKHYNMFTTRNFPVAPYVLQALGKNTDNMGLEEANKLAREAVSKKLVTDSVMKRALDLATTGTGKFAGLTDRLMGAWDGLTSTFKDMVFIPMRALGKDFIDALSPILNQINDQAKWDNFAGKIASWGPIFNEAFATLYKDVFPHLVSVGKEALQVFQDIGKTVFGIKDGTGSHEIIQIVSERTIQLLDLAKSGLSWIDDHLPGIWAWTQRIATTIGTIWAVGRISAFVGAINNIAKGISFLDTALSWASKGLGTLGSTLVELAVDNPIGAIVAGAVALGAAAWVVAANWQKVGPVLQGVWEQINPSLEQAARSVQKAVTEILGPSLEQATGSVQQALTEIFAPLWDPIKGPMGRLGNSIEKYFSSMFGFVSTVAGSVGKLIWEKGAEWGDAFTAAMDKAFSPTGPILKVTDVLTSLLNHGFDEMGKEAAKLARGLIDSIASAIASAANPFDRLKDWWNQTWSWITGQSHNVNINVNPTGTGPSPSTTPSATPSATPKTSWNSRRTYERLASNSSSRSTVVHYSVVNNINGASRDVAESLTRQIHDTHDAFRQQLQRLSEDSDRLSLAPV